MTSADAFVANPPVGGGRSLREAWERLEGRSLIAACAAIAGLLAVLWLLFAPPTADLAAQVYRSDLFAHHGFTAWDDQWFGGHHVLGYSMVFPELGALLGPRAIGALTAATEAALFAWLMWEWAPKRAQWPALWFAVGTLNELMIGRLTFALGTAVGIGALIAWRRDRPLLAATIAAVCAGTSPVAGLFLSIAGLTLAFTHGDRDVPFPRRLLTRGAMMPLLALGLAPFVVDVALAVAFPDGGSEPYSAMAALITLIMAGLVALALEPSQRILRIGIAVFAVGVVAAFTLPTPMGANAERMIALFAGPLVLVAGRRKPRAAIVALLCAAGVYEATFGVQEVIKGVMDNAGGEASYYRPVINFLAAQRGQPPARVEVPFTRGHWEAVYLAAHVPLARGWETQLDTKYDDIFLHSGLAAAAYHRWLNKLGVRWVAVPDVPLDRAGEAEAALISNGLSYLDLRSRSAHWTIYEVRHAKPLTVGPARLDSLDPTSFALTATAPGTTEVRVRYTPYWELVSGVGCIEPSHDGFTLVELVQPGPARVAVRFSLDRVGATSLRCRGMKTF